MLITNGLSANSQAGLPMRSMRASAGEMIAPSATGGAFPGDGTSEPLAPPRQRAIAGPVPRTAAVVEVLQQRKHVPKIFKPANLDGSGRLDLAHARHNAPRAANAQGARLRYYSRRNHRAEQDWAVPRFPEASGLSRCRHETGQVETALAPPGESARFTSASNPRPGVDPISATVLPPTGHAWHAYRHLWLPREEVDVIPIGVSFVPS